MNHQKLFTGLLLLAVARLSPGAEPDPVLVATPRAKVLATTAASRPFLAANRTQLAVDLAARGYTEAEVAVSAIGAQAWTTRMLVRRPADARRFSGRVIVEVLDATAQHDAAPLWGFSRDYFLRSGDVWVGVTVTPGSVDALQRFNAARYATLNLLPGPVGSCEVDDGAVASAAHVISQAGALLRSSSKESPLLGLSPQRLVVAGYAGGGDLVAYFAAMVHRRLRLGDDAPIFDGYLNVSGLAGVSPACAARLPRGVPFVSVLTAREIALAPDRDHGDAQTDGLRVYEIAGADRASALPAGLPATADLARAGVPAAESQCREPVMDQALMHALNAVWRQLDDLLVLQQPMTNTPGIEADASGAASGGWRHPQVDLPLAGHPPGSTRAPVAAGAPRTCNAATGSMTRFDAATLKLLYGDRAAYLRQFNAAVDLALTQRRLVKEDADALKASAARTVPAF